MVRVMVTWSVLYPPMAMSEADALTLADQHRAAPRHWPVWWASYVGYLIVKRLE